MAGFKNKFNSDRQEWETPDSIFIKLNEEFTFSLDVCALPENAKCERFFSPVDDGLQQRWVGSCWMNPPFKEQKTWVEKAYNEAKKEGCTVVCLLPARTNTNWWHEYCQKGEIRFIVGRPKFKGAKYGLPLPLAIVIFDGIDRIPQKAFYLNEEGNKEEMQKKGSELLGSLLG